MLKMIKERLISALLAILLIATFQPFGLAYLGDIRWKIFIGLSIIIALSCILVELIFSYVLKLPTDITRGQKFIIKRNIGLEVCLFVVLTISMSVFLNNYANNDIVNNTFSLQNIITVATVNLYSIFIIHLFWRNVYKKRYLRKQLEEAQMLNGVLHERARMLEIQKQTPQPTTKQEQDVYIEGTTKESLYLNLNDFIYAESEGNYVSVKHIVGGQLKQTLIRISIKNISEILCGNNNIMQCHRAYIANLQKVERVEGRSSGFSLIMHHNAGTIPVSKAYSHNVKECIQNPNK